MSILSDITSSIEGLSPVAAGWLSATSGTPVVVPGTPAQIASQYAAIAAQQQANTQAALLAQQPTLAGVLGNSTVVIFGLIAAVLVFILLLRK